MAGDVVASIHNTAGHQKIRIGVKRFKCMGALPPFDHPHIFIDMGDDKEAVCSYCSTHYCFDDTLYNDQTNPAGCLAP